MVPGAGLLFQSAVMGWVWVYNDPQRSDGCQGPKGWVPRGQSGTGTGQKPSFLGAGLEVGSVGPVLCWSRWGAWVCEMWLKPSSVGVGMAGAWGYSGQPSSVPIQEPRFMGADWDPGATGTARAVRSGQC